MAGQAQKIFSKFPDFHFCQAAQRALMK